MRIDGLNLGECVERGAGIIRTSVRLDPQGQPLRVQRRVARLPESTSRGLRVSPQMEQTARAAQLPLTRTGAAWLGCEQPFVPLQRFLEQ